MKPQSYRSAYTEIYHGRTIFVVEDWDRNTHYYDTAAAACKDFIAPFDLPDSDLDSEVTA